MKLKNRIIVGFLMIILMPMLLLAATLFGISEAQHHNSSSSDTVQESAYDITIADTESSQTSIQIMTKDLFYRACDIDFYKCFHRSLDIQKCGNSAG